MSPLVEIGKKNRLHAFMFPARVEIFLLGKPAITALFFWSKDYKK
jgi:hypothetical protein